MGSKLFNHLDPIFTPGPGLISGRISAADRHGVPCKFSQNSVGGIPQMPGQWGQKGQNLFCGRCFAATVVVPFCEMVRKTVSKA